MFHKIIVYILGLAPKTTKITDITLTTQCANALKVPTSKN